MLSVVFLSPRCNECKCRFGCGDLESIVIEPLFECVHVLLKMCGGGLGFRVLCEDSDVVCI